jgi:hypothetical protein
MGAIQSDVGIAPTLNKIHIWERWHLPLCRSGFQPHLNKRLEAASTSYRKFHITLNRTRASHLFLTSVVI